MRDVKGFQVTTTSPSPLVEGFYAQYIFPLAKKEKSLKNLKESDYFHSLFYLKGISRSCCSPSLLGLQTIGPNRF